MQEFTFFFFFLRNQQGDLSTSNFILFVKLCQFSRIGAHSLLRGALNEGLSPSDQGGKDKFLAMKILST